MRRKILKFISLAVLALFLVSSAACSLQPTNNTNSASSAVSTDASNLTKLKPDYLKDTSPITLDWYIDENWYTRAKWGDDLTSQYITKKTGVTLNIIIPTGDNTAKKNTMIASGDLPDIIGMGQWLPEWRQLQDAGMLWSFQELSKQFDPTFFDVTAKSELAYWKAEDGKNYVYPNSNWPTEKVANARYLSGPAVSVRSDLYNAIGKPDMRTPEGFLNALKLASQKFPLLNGQPIIPFLIGSDFVSDGNRALDSDLLRLTNTPYEKDGKFYKYAGRTDPEVVTWLKVLQKATQMGFITKDQFTARDAQLQTLFKSGRVFATMYAPNTVIQFNGAFYKVDPKSVYLPVEAIQNSKKEISAQYLGGLCGWQVNMITKKCKNPARAIQFFHYWLSDEGQNDFWYGDPSMYVLKDGRKYMKDDIYNLRDTDELAFCRKYGGRDNYFMLMQAYTGDVYKQNIQPYEEPYYNFWNANGRFVDASEFEGVDPVANSPADIALQKSRTKWGEILPRLLIAKNDNQFDRLLMDYKTVDDEAAAIYMPEVQKKYDKNKELLGK